MTDIVKEKMPVSASFFFIPIEAFQRIFVDIRITSAFSGFTIGHETRLRFMTYSGHPLWCQIR